MLQQTVKNSLHYATSIAQRRPAALTALGVLSIVIASLGIPVSGFLCFAAAANCTSISETMTPSPTWSPPSAPLTRAQIAAVQTKITAMGGRGQLNAAQSAALAAYLALPAETLFYPGPDATMQWQVQEFGNYRNNYVDIRTHRGKLILPLTGGSSVQSEKLAYTTSGPKTTIKPMQATAVVCEVISIVLYVLLMVAGITVLRNRPRGRTLHRWYAALGICAFLAWALISRGNWFGTIGSLVETLPAVLGLIYAIGIAMVLQNPIVIAYYSTND